MAGPQVRILSSPWNDTSLKNPPKASFNQDNWLELWFEPVYNKTRYIQKSSKGKAFFEFESNFINDSLNFSVI